MRHTCHTLCRTPHLPRCQHCSLEEGLRLGGAHRCHREDGVAGWEDALQWRRRRVAHTFLFCTSPAHTLPGTDITFSAPSALGSGPAVSRPRFTPGGQCTWFSPQEVHLGGWRCHSLGYHLHSYSCWDFSHLSSTPFSHRTGSLHSFCFTPTAYCATLDTWNHCTVGFFPVYALHPALQDPLQFSPCTLHSPLFLHLCSSAREVHTWEVYHHHCRTVRSGLVTLDLFCCLHSHLHLLHCLTGRIFTAPPAHLTAYSAHTL